MCWLFCCFSSCWCDNFSSFRCFHIYNRIMCYFPCPFSHFVPRKCYSGAFIYAIAWFWKCNASFVTFTSHQKFVSCCIPSSVGFPVVASISTAEWCAIFLALSSITFHDSNNFVIYSDSRSALQALGGFYTRNPLFPKLQDLSPPGSPPTLGSLSTKNFSQPTIMLYPFGTTFPLFAIPSMPPGSPIGSSVLRMAISWLSWNLPLAHGCLVLNSVAA